ncbi:MAG TPA: HD domain-containing phosphohydrolase [Thermoleophilaceae bacterium]|nr:HD domain-containing phosphohydrolase [Thermoleophilaceae bacterium]
MVRRRQSAMLGAEILLGGMAVAAALAFEPFQGNDGLELVALFLVLAIASDAFAIVTDRGFNVSGSLLATVLAIALTGAAGGVLVGTLSALVDGLRLRRPVASLVSNVSAYAVFPLAGATTLDWLADASHATVGSLAYAGAIMGAFVVALLVNFLQIAAHQRVFYGRSIRGQIVTVLVPLLPSEILTGLLGATVATLYPKLGVAVIVLIALVLLGFQYVLRELQRSQLRAERLRALQVDVLFSMVRSLSLRDSMTARHSAAVARYAQAIARAAGASSVEQRLVHTAALLHDIGKSIFPDHVLFAEGSLNDEQWEIVKQHPAHGASVIAQIEEFADIAAVVHAHHERIDGTGYPNNLRGDDVPWLARMISIADTYDVMTARDSYRDPVSSQEAIAELRRVSGTQLDGELVEIFVQVLASEALAFGHGDDTDFERELAQERARALAVPSLLEAVT